MLLLHIFLCAFAPYHLSFVLTFSPLTLCPYSGLLCKIVDVLSISSPRTLLSDHISSHHALSSCSFLLCARFHVNPDGSRNEVACPARQEECSTLCLLGPILGLSQNRAGGPPNVARSSWKTTILGVGESYQVLLDFHFAEYARSCREMLSAPPPQS